MTYVLDFFSLEVHQHTANESGMIQISREHKYANTDEKQTTNKQTKQTNKQKQYNYTTMLSWLIEMTDKILILKMWNW